MGTRPGVPAPCEQRVRASLVKNDSISCSWLHLLKFGSTSKPGAIQFDHEIDSRDPELGGVQVTHWKAVLYRACGSFDLEVPTEG